MNLNIPSIDKERLLAHLDHSNPDTFEVEDLTRLIKQVGISSLSAITLFVYVDSVSQCKHCDVIVVMAMNQQLLQPHVSCALCPWGCLLTYLLSYLVAVLLSDNVVGHIHKVALRQAGLVLRWVTVHGYTVVVFNQATQANSAWSSLCG